MYALQHEVLASQGIPIQGIGGSPFALDRRPGNNAKEVLRPASASGYCRRRPRIVHR